MILRPHQQANYDALSDEVFAGRNPLLVAPCGYGKGTVCTVIVNRTVAAGFKVIFAVHGKSLVVDMSERVDKLGIPHGVLMGGERRERWHPVQIASIDTLHRMHHPPEADLIIVDEAHMSMSPTWRKALSRYPKARVIGMTATPCRLDGKGLGKATGGLFDSMVLGPSEEELIRMGDLVGSRVLAPPPPADIGAVKKTAGEFNSKQLATVCDKTKVIGDIVEHYKRYALGRKSAAFGVDQSHAFHMAEQFNAAGIPFAYVDASTDQDERRRIWRDLDEDNGNLMGVSSCGITLVGWDHGIVSCLIDAAKTASLGKHKQKLGRGSRTHKGKKDFLVLDHVGNAHYHYPYGLFEQTPPWSLDGEAIRSATDEDQSPSVSTCKYNYRWNDGRKPEVQLPCYATFRAGPRECPYCGIPLRLIERKVEVEAGELEEIKRPGSQAERLEAAKVAAAQKSEYYNLLGAARSKGMKDGWAYHRFCEKYGFAPPREWIPAAREFKEAMG